MSKFKRKMDRGGLSEYEKMPDDYVNKKRKKKSNEDWKSYASLGWLIVTPMSVIKMFASYMIVALLLQPYLTGFVGPVMATVLSHGLVTSLLVVVLLNGADGKKVGLKGILVRYIMAGVIFGIGTGVTEQFLF